jgi:hypothetical protein
MMIKKTISFLIFILVTCCLFTAEKKDAFLALKGPFMGRQAPVKKAAVFMDGLISTKKDPEMCGTFTKDGKEFYYNALHKNEWSIFVTRETAKGWSKPVPLAFTAGYTDRDFTLSPDGNSIYLGSNRPRKKGGSRQERLDIFVSKRLPEGKWSQPKALGPPVNTDFGENYPCVTANGNIYYFSCRKTGIGGCDIYMAKWVNGKYAQPIVLDNAVNSKKHDWDAYIAADESYIIFSSKDRADSIGGQDLYISFKNKKGAWTKAKNMGPAVNSNDEEICPAVSLEGRYFFFTSRRRGKADIFWISADIIQKLK